MLLVDNRWQSVSGIGRYATEVTSRLNISHDIFKSAIKPSSPFDVANPGRWRFSSNDLIYSPGFNVGISRARQIITLHDMIHLSPLHRTKAKIAYYEYAVRPIVTRAKVVFTVSETSKEILEEWLNNEEISVINTGNGCSEIFFSNTDHSKHEVLDDPYFLYVGNNKPHKNVGLILSALKSDPRMRIKVVSQDSHEIRILASELGIEDQMEIMVNVDDTKLAKLYAQAVATLMPSSVEGFGLPAVESLASRTPVIYWSGCRAVAEIVRGNGLAIGNTTRPDDLVSAMQFMLQESPILLNTDDSWANKYRWESVASKVTSTLEYKCAGIRK